MSAATKDDHHALRLELESHKTETYKLVSDALIESSKSLSYQADAVNNLASKIELMTNEFSYQKAATGRLSKENEDLRKEVEIMKIDINTIETERNAAVGIGGKLMMPAIYGVLAINAATAVVPFVN